MSKWYIDYDSHIHEGGKDLGGIWEDELADRIITEHNLMGEMISSLEDIIAYKDRAKTDLEWLMIHWAERAVRKAKEGQ